jgi:hypothetical protein
MKQYMFPTQEASILRPGMVAFLFASRSMAARSTQSMSRIARFPLFLPGFALFCLSSAGYAGYQHIR